MTIGSPKSQFLSETFEIFVVGRLLFSDLKNFDFKGPKSNFEIFVVGRHDYSGFSANFRFEKF